MNLKSMNLELNIAMKEMPASEDAKKPWVGVAIKSGRKVPRWIAQLPTEKEFNEMLALREMAFSNL